MTFLGCLEMSIQNTITKLKRILFMQSPVMIYAKSEGTPTRGVTNLKNHQQGIGPQPMYALMIIHERLITKIVSTIVLKEDMVIFGAILRP